MNDRVGVFFFFGPLPWRLPRKRNWLRFYAFLRLEKKNIWQIEKLFSYSRSSIFQQSFLLFSAFFKFIFNFLNGSVIRNHFGLPSIFKKTKKKNYFDALISQSLRSNYYLLPIIYYRKTFEIPRWRLANDLGGVEKLPFHHNFVGKNC